jgi:adenosylcobinamide-GDP ribazoletransferase
MIKQFLLSLIFLTRIPLPKRCGVMCEDVKEKDFTGSTLFFPAVGLVLGGLYWVIIFFLGNIIPHHYLILLLIGCGILFTGAFHEDGVADVFDAFGSQYDKKNILRVMKDSRIGTYGGLALILLLLFKFYLLRDIALIHLAPVMLTSQVLARWVMLPIMRYMPYQRNRYTPSNTLVNGVKALPFYQLLISTLLTCIVPFVLFGVVGSVFILGVCLISFLTGWYFYKKIGGITGDCLGTIEQFSELTVYILALTLI